MAKTKRLNKRFRKTKKTKNYGGNNQLEDNPGNNLDQLDQFKNSMSLLNNYMVDILNRIKTDTIGIEEEFVYVHLSWLVNKRYYIINHYNIPMRTSDNTLTKTDKNFLNFIKDFSKNEENIELRYVYVALLPWVYGYNDILKNLTNSTTWDYIWYLFFKYKYICYSLPTYSFFNKDRIHCAYKSFSDEICIELYKHIGLIKRIKVLFEKDKDTLTTEQRDEFIPFLYKLIKTLPYTCG